MRGAELYKKDQGEKPFYSIFPPSGNIQIRCFQY
jgi:hypothetical protein